VTGDDRPAARSSVTAGWDLLARVFALAVSRGNEGHAARWSEPEWHAAAIAATSLRPAGGASGVFVMDPTRSASDPGP